jgi:hypothetical protein
MSDDTKRVSRRDALKTGMTVLAGGLTTTAAFAQDPDAGKMAKSVVQYRYHWASNGNHCGICANFLPPESCQLVAGKIDPNGYCTAFAAKKKPKQAAG